MFNPQSEYEVTFKDISLRAFVDFKDAYVTRPPYQRKNVWSRIRKQELLDSLFRRYYVPRIVIREVRLGEHTTRREVIDGQQRIITAQMFLENKLPLPKSLADIRPDLAGKYFKNLPPEVREFVYEELSYSADVVKGIEDPKDPEHQRIATEIFWRLQQGVSLNYMEKAHARLSSLSRNFVVQYADDYRFDFEAYESVDDNPKKHPFFKIISHSNDRMGHLALLTRFLILEEANGPTDLQDADVAEYIDRYQDEGGIGNLTFKDTPQARAVLENLNAGYSVFKDDPLVQDGGQVKELRREYFLVSVYLLLRHLKNLYMFTDQEKDVLRSFLIHFYRQWQDSNNKNTDVLTFSEARQQDANNVANRHMVLRQLFFDYARGQNHEMLTKDERRAFNEAERIAIYRRDEGLCQVCLKEGKPVAEARVPWREYDADHVVAHAQGGATEVANAQVLCRYHNRQKGASPVADAQE